MTRFILLLVLSILLLNACSDGNTVVNTYDHKTGKTTTINYAPSYISDAINVDEGLDLKITGLNTKKINPIIHSVKKAAGALGPEDMEFSMSFVVHFRNLSSRQYDLQLTSINLNEEEQNLVLENTTLEPQATYSTKEILGTFSHWDAKTTEEITVFLNFTVGNKKYRDFPVNLKRETLEQLKKRIGT